MARAVHDEGNAMVKLYLTREEINVLAVAAAKGVDPESEPHNASEAGQVIWGEAFKRPGYNPVLCSLATMMAEATQ